MSLPKPCAYTKAGQTVEVNMTINGTAVTMSLPARVTLADALREHLGLTGTHVGCEHGVCGMCTVLVDGQAARACLLFAIQVDGAEITTVEGLGRPDNLHVLQEAFGRHHALQCGFCTPGFLMSSFDLLSHEPAIQRDDLPAELSGVLCRCTGYRNIVAAVNDVAEAHRDGIPAPGNCVPRTLVGRSPAAALGTRSAEADRFATAQSDEIPPEPITLPAVEPTIDVNVNKAIAASPDEVTRIFADIRTLARCLPGAELTDELGNGWYRGRVRVALGPIRLSFKGVTQMIDQSTDRIVVRAQGRDSSGGSAQAEVMMTAQPSASGTMLQAQAKVFLTGRIASFGRSLVSDVSRGMFEDFARAVNRVVTGGEPDTAPPPPRFFTIFAAALAHRMRGVFQRMRHRVRPHRGARTQQDR